MPLITYTRALSSLALSAVHRGVAFEQRSLRVLHEHLSMSLRRVGGRSDGGIDLQGWWWLPTSPDPHSNRDTAARAQDPQQITRRRIRLLGQCKAEKKKIGPNYIREMEGVIHRHITRTPDIVARTVATANNLLPDDDAENPSFCAPAPVVVALFISSSPFTKAALIHAQSSPIPFILLHLPTLSSDNIEENPDSIPQGDNGRQNAKEEDTLGSIVLNHTLSHSSGPLSGEIEVRWERPLGSHSIGRPGLWWKGKRIPSWTPDS